MHEDKRYSLIIPWTLFCSFMLFFMLYTVIKIEPLRNFVFAFALERSIMMMDLVILFLILMLMALFSLAFVTLVSLFLDAWKS